MPCRSSCLRENRCRLGLRRLRCPNFRLCCRRFRCPNLAEPERRRSRSRRRRRRCRRSAPHNQTHARAVGEFATVRWALRNHAVLLTRSREDVSHAPNPTVRLADSCLCDDGRPPNDSGNHAMGFDRPSHGAGRRSCRNRHGDPYAQGEGKQTGGRYLLNHFASPLWRLVFVGGCRTTTGCLDYHDSPAPSLDPFGSRWS